MAFDVVSNRELISKLRKIAGKTPFAWQLYGLYWKFRRQAERRRDYPKGVELINFGTQPAPTLTSPASQLCTADQMLSETYDRWCHEMFSPPRFSRKQWEFVYILQSLEARKKLRTGVKGLGFGCGREPLAGLFAKYGCQIQATDLASDTAKQQGWVDTMQHSENLDELYESAKRFISKSDFFERVQFCAADMNAIPEQFKDQYDFVWSACALEHLGSLRHGMDFIKNSLRCLKPGGIAVHTTEFNLSSDDQTFESPACSLYREQDIRALIKEIEADGYVVAPLTLNSGTTPVDRHIDLPPYGFSPHIKLELEGYVITSIGLVIEKPLT